MSVEEARPGEGPVVLETGRFLEAVHKSLAPLVGTHIHDSALRDHRRKCGLDSQEYVDWLRVLFRWLEEDTGLRAPMRVLDVGCGTGELTVLINKLGHEAWGVDLHQEHLELARILAEENGLDATRFSRHARYGTFPSPTTPSTWPTSMWSWNTSRIQSSPPSLGNYIVWFGMGSTSSYPTDSSG